MRRSGIQSASSADAIDARAYELEAEAARLHAEACRLRVSVAKADVIAATDLPLPKKLVLEACRSGALPAVKKGRTWLVTRADAEAFLAKPAKAKDAEPVVEQLDDALRKKLGLAPQQRRAS